MPYPETCPECGGAFRNTGTHYTARRNELGRHVLLELGCQNTSRRYWWDFTTGSPAEDGATPGRRVETVNAVANGTLAHTTNGTNGHTSLVTLEPPVPEPEPEPAIAAASVSTDQPLIDEEPVPVTAQLDAAPTHIDDPIPMESFPVPEVLGPLPGAPASLKDAFLRQLQLDRLTLRQMRSWLMAEDARRAMEVAASATEATYERLALILFGEDLPQLLGKQPAPPPTPGMSAEERLELQREKARVRARLRRAAAKAARQS